MSKKRWTKLRQKDSLADPRTYYRGSDSHEIIVWFGGALNCSTESHCLVILTNGTFWIIPKKNNRKWTKQVLKENMNFVHYVDSIGISLLVWPDGTLNGYLDGNNFLKIWNNGQYSVMPCYETIN